MITKEKILGTVQAIIFVAVLIVVLESGSTKTWIGLILFFGALGAYGVWKNKQMLMDIVRQIETTFYGKPLDKDLWKKGEKKRKFKIVRNKKR